MSTIKEQIRREIVIFYAREAWETSGRMPPLSAWLDFPASFEFPNETNADVYVIGTVDEDQPDAWAVISELREGVMDDEAFLSVEDELEREKYLAWVANTRQTH